MLVSREEPQPVANDAAAEGAHFGALAAARLISAMASKMRVRVLSPRKSIFSRPTFSAIGPSNCVRTFSSLSRQSGMTPSSGWSARTPASRLRWPITAPGATVNRLGDIHNKATFERGYFVRTTVSEIGPVLMARLLQ